MEVYHEGGAREALKEWAYAQLLSYGKPHCRRCRTQDAPLALRQFLVPRRPEAGAVQLGRRRKPGPRAELGLELCGECARREAAARLVAELRGGWRGGLWRGKARAALWAARGGRVQPQATAGLLMTLAARRAVNRDYPGALEAIRAARRFTPAEDLDDILGIVKRAAEEETATDSPDALAPPAPTAGA